jgi:tetratricopeptide (TPR) repeat protein
MISIKNSRLGRLRPVLMGVWSSLLIVFAVSAQPADPAAFARQAAAEYRRAQTAWHSATNDAPAAWQFASACFDLAEYATNDEQRADLAVQGIEACRKLIREQPQSGPAHNYLAMDLGQLARTELLGALSLVREMEGEFKTAWSLDQEVDYAGAARNLGQLYRDSPGWPTSIGSKIKAREWLERAARTAPDYPENRLLLGESYLQWDEPAAARKELKALDQLWPKARTHFTGAVWAPYWADWVARRVVAEGKAGQPDAPKRAPR